MKMVQHEGHMRNIYTTLCIFIMSLSASLGAQSWSERLKQFTPEAVVQHGSASATVTANDPEPLLQAITAVREEYGWVVDFEAPPYASKYDLIDSTDPTWRQNHPGAPGVTAIAGGLFQSTYPETPEMHAASSEEAALEKIISDYNASGNPGKFRLLKEEEGRYAVVGMAMKDDGGQDKAVTSPFDTVVSVDSTPQSGPLTVNAILKALSLKSGVKCGVLEYGPFRYSHVTVIGQSASARSLLMQIFASSGANNVPVFQWVFDPERKKYYLSIFAASRTVRTSAGKKHRVFLEK